MQFVSVSRSVPPSVPQEQPVARQEVSVVQAEEEEEDEEEDRKERGPKAGLSRSCCTFVSANLRKSLLLEFAYPNGQEFDSMTDKFYKMWLRNKFLPIRDLTKKQRKAVSFTCSFQPFGKKHIIFTKIFIAELWQSRHQPASKCSQRNKAQ